jgi:TIR domain
MSKLADLPDLIGFFSYSRDDDQGSYGALSALRDRVQQELRAQLGRSFKSFRLWQDKEAIPSGTLWEATIKNAVAQSVFFIPIITPTVVASRYCRFELESFLAREAELGRDDLVFPILYIDVPELEDSAQLQKDPVLSIVAKRQYVDWRKLRHREIYSPDVSEAVERFCRHIRDALLRTWISPQERKAQEEVAAAQRAEADEKRQEAQKEHEAQEEAAAAQRAEAEQKRQEAETRRREEEAQKEREAHEEAAAAQRAEAEQKRPEAETRRREEEAQKEREAQEEAAAVQRAETDEKRQEAEARRREEEEQKERKAREEAAAVQRAETEAEEARERRRRETDAWAAASTAGDLVALTAFLTDWPLSEHAGAARARIGELKAAPPGKVNDAGGQPKAKRVGVSWQMIAGGAVLLGVIAVAGAWQRRTPSTPAPTLAGPQAIVPQVEEPRDPGVSLAELTLRMRDEDLVKSAIIRAAKVLASAGKEAEFFEEGCDKDPKVGNFYRGMILAHAGYFLVMADLRTGSYRNYGLLPEDYPNLERASLFSYWTKERVSNVWRSSNALAALPADDKKAIATFLNELKSYRSIYAIVKRAKPRLDTMDWSAGSPVATDEISEILKKAGRPPIGSCYKSDYGYKLTWDATTSGATAINFYPAEYMFSFWYRRDAEGKSDLAEWFLTSMLGWLQR